MVNNAKKIAFTIILAISILVVLLSWRSQSRWWNPVLNASEVAKSLKSILSQATIDDLHFKTICDSHNLTIPNIKLSQVRLEKFENGIAKVKVQVVDLAGKRSSANNEIIFIWATQVNGDGRSSGIVHSHGNGSYTGHVRVFWRGVTRINAKIAESTVNTCIRYRYLLRYRNIVYSHKEPWGLLGIFKNQYLQKKTRCGTSSYLYGYNEVCNFTAINDGSAWYCGKPLNHTLNCKHIHSFGTGDFQVHVVTEQDKIKSPGRGTVAMSVTVNSTFDANMVAATKCKMTSKRSTWTISSISGFLGKVWQPVQCRGPTVHSFASYRTCLNGKYLVFIGDSTVRQYFEYITSNILQLRVPDKHVLGPGRRYHPTTVLSHNNITAYFRRHELPWHLADAPANGIKSTANLLRDLANSDTQGHSLIIMLNYFSHGLPYPTSNYRQRLRMLVEAIQYMLTKKPGATILYKGPTVCNYDNRWFDQNFGFLFRDILFEEFFDIMDSVIYLDTWDISIAHNYELLHPQGRCMQSQIQQMMAYLCD